MKIFLQYTTQHPCWIKTVGVYDKQRWPQAVNPTPVPKLSQEIDWKETLKQEFVENIKSQMKGLTQELMKEIKALPAAATLPPHPEQKR